MIDGQKIAPSSFEERMQVPGVWLTDLDDPAKADVLVVATGASRHEDRSTGANINRFAGLLRDRGASVVVLDAEELCPETARHPGTPEALRQFVRLSPPQAMVVFGEKAVRNVGRTLSSELPAPPLPGAGIVDRDLNGCRMIPMLSLAPPAWNRWKRWAWPYLTQVADHIVDHLVHVKRASSGYMPRTGLPGGPYVVAEGGRRV